MRAQPDWRRIPSPAPPRFDAAALRDYLTLVGDPVPLIRRGLPAISQPVWSNTAGALAALFGLDNANHCFRVTPHRWATFHEPQVTGGFAHFLNDGNHDQRRGRAIALVKAAMLCAGGDPATIDLGTVDSVRCTAEESRTDILVELRSGSQRFGVAIEAKFGHRLTSGQLAKATRTALDTRNWRADRSTLLVIAPDIEAIDAALVRKVRRATWHTTCWWSFLHHLERQTGADFDSLDYRRFRRTVWHRAY